MHEQLVLVSHDDDRAWRLDEQTRDVGRRGVQEARAALRQAATERTTDAPAISRRRLRRLTAA